MSLLRTSCWIRDCRGQPFSGFWCSTWPKDDSIYSTETSVANSMSTCFVFFWSLIFRISQPIGADLQIHVPSDRRTWSSQSLRWVLWAARIWSRGSSKVFEQSTKACQTFEVKQPIEVKVRPSVFPHLACHMSFFKFWFSAKMTDLGFVCDQPCLPRDQSIVVHLPSQHVQNSTLQRRGTWRAIRDHGQRSYLIAREAKADHLCVPANNMFELLTKLSNSWFGFMVVHADQDLKHVISWFQWRRYPALDLSFFRVSSHDLSHLGFKTTSVCV